MTVVNAGIFIGVNIHAVCHCVLTQWDTRFGIYSACLCIFLTACTSKTKLCSEVHVSRTHQGSLISKV